MSHCSYCVTQKEEKKYINTGNAMSRSMVHLKKNQKKKNQTKKQKKKQAKNSHRDKRSISTFVETDL